MGSILNYELNKSGHKIFPNYTHSKNDWLFVKLSETDLVTKVAPLDSFL